MPKMHVRKGDLVQVIAGKDRGKTGKVLKALPSVQKVIVEKCGLVTKSVKPSPSNPKGGRLTVEAPIHVSNVMLVDPETGKPTRVNVKRDPKGNLIRVSKKSGTEF